MNKDTPFWKYCIVIAFCLCVTLFYIWTAWSSQRSLIFTVEEGHYNLLAEAFLSGQLHFPVDPSQQLLSLEDPYDPVQNKRYRLHDASLYKGKYYTYFGPAPVVILYMPWQLLTGTLMPDLLATTIFLCGIFLVGVLILIRARKQMAPESSFGMLLACIAALGICSVSPYLLRQTGFYEVAIASGCFWYLLSCYLLFMFSIPFREQLSSGRLSLLGMAGFCYGLAIASRPNYVLGVCFFIIPVLSVWKSGIDAKGIRKSILSFMIPLACIGMLLMTYNYLRFDDPFELGRAYQLDSTTVTEWLSISNFFHNAYLYLLFPLIPDHIFPFFHLTIFTDWYTIPSFLSHHYEYYGPEPVMGILTNLPFLLGILPFFIFLFLKHTNSHRPYLIRYTGLLMIPACLNLIVLLLLSAASMRYILDFLPSFLLAAGMGWMLLEVKIRQTASKGPKLLFYPAVTVLLLWSMMVSISISMTGYHNALSIENPRLFNKIAGWFRPISSAYHKKHLDMYGAIRLQLRFPAKRRGAEVLILAQTWAGPDIVFVQYMGAGHVRIGALHRGKAKFSESFRVDASSSYTLIVEMGSLYPKPIPSLLIAKGVDTNAHQRIKIMVKGHTLLQGTANFQECHPHNVFIAGDDKLKKGRLPWFSGKILTLERLPLF